MSPSELQQSFAVICDSSCELSPEQCMHMDVTLVSSRIFFKSEEHLDRNTTLVEVAAEIRGDISRTRVSMPGRESFEAVFDELIDRGISSIVVVTASSLLSSSYEAAVSAAHEVSGAHIEVLDTKGFSAQLALVVLRLVCDRKAGIPFNEAVRRALVLSQSTRLLMIVPTSVNPEQTHLLGNARGLRRSLMLLSLKVSGGYVLTSLNHVGNVVVERRSNDLSYLIGVIARKMSLYSHQIGPLTRLEVYPGNAKMLASLEKPFNTNEFRSECGAALVMRPSTALVMGLEAMGVAFAPQSLISATEAETLLQKEEKK